jgi:hypothetical protein
VRETRQLAEAIAVGHGRAVEGRTCELIRARPWWQFNGSHARLSKFLREGPRAGLTCTNAPRSTRPWDHVRVDHVRNLVPPLMQGESMTSGGTRTASGFGARALTCLPTGALRHQTGPAVLLVRESEVPVMHRHRTDVDFRRSDRDRSVLAVPLRQWHRDPAGQNNRATLTVPPPRRHRRPRGSGDSPGPRAAARMTKHDGAGESPAPRMVSRTSDAVISQTRSIRSMNCCTCSIAASTSGARLRSSSPSRERA